MNWVVLSYTLSTGKSSSSPRVALWRRLKRLGAVSPVGSLYVLPAQDGCTEGFQWLAQEIRQDGGEALVFFVDQFEGLTTQQVEQLFNEARKKDYEELLETAATLELGLSSEEKTDNHLALVNSLAKLRKQYREIKAIDYFNCSEGRQLEQALSALERRLEPVSVQVDPIVPLSVDAYRSRRWITRPRPHVDRLAVAWLIRRFIDPDAAIRYSTEPDEDEVAFDMSVGEFTHYGNLCTFETMLHAFSLIGDPGLAALAEVVHEIDLHDGRYLRPEAAGVEAILNGWLLAELSDYELEVQGMTLFTGLYLSLSAPSTRGY